MMRPESRFVRPGEIRLHVTTWGDENAPPVLLVHGLWDHNRSWDWIAAKLAQSHYVIAPDLRGHGDSQWAGPDGYTLGAYVLDLADLIDAMELDDLLLVGHSLGGALGLRLAAAYPDRIAALFGIECVTLPIQRDEMAAPTPYPSRLREWIEKRREKRSTARTRFANEEEARQRLASNHPSLDADTIKRLVVYGLRELPDGGYAWKFDPLVRGRPPEDQRAYDLRDVLAGVACPTLLVYGDSAKRPAPGPDLLALMRDVRLEIMPGGSHSLHHQMRDALLDLLTPFLEQHSRKACHA
ncbi:alpha/beta fold hydrolase [Erythrobacter sp. EC-HK427]|uniref:alpha/beta fold hydrolase n=1 Tax=Erythrobacter sp. EC-HK427 TaxID=2038396 RepID=UPI001259F0AB|nr:alpha/beta hydrolase [Erythrobacter sp. EC-HK427]VVT10346.1 Alpha/beta hydrolase [Erythrobacter sp. EC-HK427]